MSGAENDDVKRLTVDISRELDSELEAHLDYGDTKMAFIREAIRERIERDRTDAN